MKEFPVVDCDGHIYEPEELWTDYVEAAYRDDVRAALWREDRPGGFDGWLNGEPHISRRDNGAFFGAITTPGIDKEALGQLRMALDPFDIAPGSYDPVVRLHDMDAMGIDVAMLLPTFCGMYFSAIQDVRGALGLAQAYNRWILDYAAADPDRLYPAAIVPQHDDDIAIAEIRRVADAGFRCVIIRPNVIAGRHPADPSFGPIWEAIADTGMVAGVHPFPAANGKGTIPADCTGWFLDELAAAAGFPRRGLLSESLCFGHDAQAMLTFLCHHDFFAHHPRLKLAILESNAGWLPSLLSKLDGRVKAWTATRGTEVTVGPEEGFRRQGFVSFESDETIVFRLWDEFEDIGVWASDYPHFDAEDAWEAIDGMRAVGVPETAIAKLMGANAARMYGIEPRLHVRDRQVVS